MVRVMAVFHPGFYWLNLQDVFKLIEITGGTITGRAQLIRSLSSARISLEISGNMN